jgi:hypothetical protein
MCILINFYEILPAGMFSEEGFVAKIPDGRGIRHYDDVCACYETTNANEDELLVIPTSGYVQVSLMTGSTCDSNTHVEFEDHWEEYALVCDEDILDVEYLPGIHAIVRLGRRYDIDVENIELEPHKDLDGHIYTHHVLGACIKK